MYSASLINPSSWRSWAFIGEWRPTDRPSDPIAKTILKAVNVNFQGTEGYQKRDT